MEIIVGKRGVERHQGEYNIKEAEREGVREKNDIVIWNKGKMDVDEVRQYKKKERQILREWDQNVLLGGRKEKGEVRRVIHRTWKKKGQGDRK